MFSMHFTEFNKQAGKQDWGGARAQEGLGSAPSQGGTLSKACHSQAHPFILSLLCSFTHSPGQVLIEAFTPSLIDSGTHSLIHSFTCPGSTRKAATWRAPERVPGSSGKESRQPPAFSELTLVGETDDNHPRWSQVEPAELWGGGGDSLEEPRVNPLPDCFHVFIHLFGQQRSSSWSGHVREGQVLGSQALERQAVGGVAVGW